MYTSHNGNRARVGVKPPSAIEVYTRYGTSHFFAHLDDQESAFRTICSVIDLYVLPQAGGGGGV